MVPVYVFGGFIESGKSSFILDTLHNEDFTEGTSSLLIVLEQGSVDYDYGELKENCLTDLVYVEKESDLTFELFEDLNQKYHPSRVLIEFNGTWSMSNFLDVTAPDGWEIAQIMTTIDASTFSMYISNMRSMMYEQIVHAELIICNRCNENTDYLFLRNNLKSINPNAQIIYETKDGILDQLPEGQLPFDINQDPITIEDHDFGIWYMDAMENPQKYKGKKIHVGGVVLKNEQYPDQFALSREVMVCCADDIAPIGFICYYRNASQLMPGEWVDVLATIDSYFDPDYHQEIIILEIEQLKIVPNKENNLVYYS